MYDNGGFTSGNDTRSQPSNTSWPTSPTPSTSPNPAGTPAGQYYSSRPGADLLPRHPQAAQGPDNRHDRRACRGHRAHRHHADRVLCPLSERDRGPGRGGGSRTFWR